MVTINWNPTNSIMGLIWKITHKNDLRCYRIFILLAIYMSFTSPPPAYGSLTGPAASAICFQGNRRVTLGNFADIFFYEIIPKELTAAGGILRISLNISCSRNAPLVLSSRDELPSHSPSGTAIKSHRMTRLPSNSPARHSISNYMAWHGMRNVWCGCGDHVMSCVCLPGKGMFLFDQISFCPQKFSEFWWFS